MLTGIVVLYCAKLFKVVEFPDFSPDIVKKVSCVASMNLYTY